MFGFLKKEHFLYSPVKGGVVNVTNVPDMVFSKKILGEGFAVLPCDNRVLCPASGIISDVAETLHAYCINADDGLEILVHIGIDTVKLKGKHFESMVKAGQRVKALDPLAVADMAAIEKEGFCTCCVVVATNSQILKEFKVLEAPSNDNYDKAMIYKL